jgi:hypothetical protein
MNQVEIKKMGAQEIRRERGRNRDVLLEKRKLCIRKGECLTF